MRLLLLIICVLLPLAGFSQAGYHLKFKIEGLNDTTLYLGNFYGETTYIKDTARSNSRGEFEFKGSKPLLYRGEYFIVLKQNGKPTTQFYFLIADNQQFSMETKSSDYVKFMKVTGDLDNTLFFENMIFNGGLNKEAEPFVKILQDSTQSAEKKKEARIAYNRVNEKALAHQNEVIAKHPNTLTAKIVRAHQPVTVPDPPKRKDGTIDSTFQLKWYRKHFFDNFDLAEQGLICLQTPLYKNKINEYLDKLFIQQPDSILNAMALYIDRAKPNQETFKYATWITLLKYQQPEIMGLDEIYVRMYDKYYGSGMMDFWVNEKLKKNLKEHADRMRYSLVGMKAPNLIMQDVNLKPKSMYDIKNKYTVLFIFDPDCGHCKEETPKLVKFYNLRKYDFQVYAVSADTSMQKMKEYIKEMKMPWITVNGPRTYVGPYDNLYDAIVTPSLYIIDENKKIIAKKVPVDKLNEIIRQKTASLIASCCGMGASSVGADAQAVDRMKRFGELAGMAFQIKDDLFDYEDGDIGKPVGIDIKEKKLTLPLIHALSKASWLEKRKIIRIIKNESDKPKKVKEVIAFVKASGGIEYAHDVMKKFHQEALQLLETFPESTYKKSLIQLVQYTIERNK